MSEDDWTNPLAFMMRALRLKAVMIERKKAFCKTTCTIGGCKGELHVRLAKPNNHLRAWCTACEHQAME